MVNRRDGDRFKHQKLNKGGSGDRQKYIYLGGLLIKMTRTNPVRLLSNIEIRMAIAKRIDVGDSPCLAIVAVSMDVIGAVV